jgi:hypothetical protein
MTRPEAERQPEEVRRRRSALQPPRNKAPAHAMAAAVPSKAKGGPVSRRPPASATHAVAAGQAGVVMSQATTQASTASASDPAASA